MGFYGFAAKVGDYVAKTGNTARDIDELLSKGRRRLKRCSLISTPRRFVHLTCGSTSRCPMGFYGFAVKVGEDRQYTIDELLSIRIPRTKKWPQL